MLGMRGVAFQCAILNNNKIKDLNDFFSVYAHDDLQFYEFLYVEIYIMVLLHGVKSLSMSCKHTSS